MPTSGGDGFEPGFSAARWGPGSGSAEISPRLAAGQEQLLPGKAVTALGSIYRAARLARRRRRPGCPKPMESRSKGRRRSFPSCKKYKIFPKPDFHGKKTTAENQTRFASRKTSVETRREAIFRRKSPLKFPRGLFSSGKTWARTLLRLFALYKLLLRFFKDDFSVATPLREISEAIRPRRTRSDKRRRRFPGGEPPAKNFKPAWPPANRPCIFRWPLSRTRAGFRGKAVDFFTAEGRAGARRSSSRGRKTRPGRRRRGRAGPAFARTGISHPARCSP